jgi:hypothetical protein
MQYLLLHSSGPKRIELCCVYAICRHCIDGSTSSQLLAAGRMQIKYNLPRRISPHNFSLATSLQEDHTNIIVRISAMAWAQPRASLQEAQEKV